VSGGHTLLIPKAHHPWLQETPDALIAEIFILAKKLMRAIKAGLPCDYVQVTIVGKDVPHLHLHLMPKYFDDILPVWPTISYQNDAEKNLFTEKIKKSMLKEE